MRRAITRQELSSDSAAVLREVQAGHAIIVTENGVPVAELRPIRAQSFVARSVIAEAARRAPRISACLEREVETSQRFDVSPCMPFETDTKVRIQTKYYVYKADYFCAKYSVLRRAAKYCADAACLLP